MFTNYEIYKDYYKDYCKKKYEYCKNHNLCVECLKETNNGKSRCVDCSNKRKAYNKNRYSMFIEHNLCVRCGKHTPIKGKRTCEKCLTKLKAHYKSKNKVIEI